MCEHGTTTVVETPDWLWSERNRPENGISVDSCIAEQIVTNTLLRHYSCAGCTWPGAIRYPTDRLASGHAKATGHDVQAFTVTTRTWVRFDDAESSSAMTDPH